MIHVTYDPEAMFGGWAAYAAWKADAAIGRQALIDWFQQPHGPKEKPPVDKALYGRLKDPLKAHFFNKCGYCESWIDAVGWGDVDHFRPKLRVHGNPNHRGYYWLTYQESNLLPSCDRCNRAGKRDRFPVHPTNAHVLVPGDITSEHPLLLSPYDPTLRDTRAHWKFEFREIDGIFTPTGFVDGITEEAKESVKVYKLNRDWLVNVRRTSQMQAVDKLKPGLLDDTLLDRALDELLDFRRQHSAAVRATCAAYLDYRARVLAQKARARIERPI